MTSVFYKRFQESIMLDIMSRGGLKEEKQKKLQDFCAVDCWTKS